MLKLSTLVEKKRKKQKKGLIEADCLRAMKAVRHREMRGNGNVCEAQTEAAAAAAVAAAAAADNSSCEEE